MEVFLVAIHTPKLIFPNLATILQTRIQSLTGYHLGGWVGGCDLRVLRGLSRAAVTLSLQRGSISGFLHTSEGTWMFLHWSIMLKNNTIQGTIILSSDVVLQDRLS